MDVLAYRLLVLIWFFAYLAAIYLVLHIVVARFIRTPDSRVLWFFSVVTSPLTRPVRALVPPGTPDSRVRLITLLVCATIWLATRMVLARFGGVDLD